MFLDYDELCTGVASCSLSTSKEFLWEIFIWRGDMPVVTWDMQNSRWESVISRPPEKGLLRRQYCSDPLEFPFNWMLTSRRTFCGLIEGDRSRTLIWRKSQIRPFFCSMKSQEYECAIETTSWIAPVLASFGARFSREQRRLCPSYPIREFPDQSDNSFLHREIRRGFPVPESCIEHGDSSVEKNRQVDRENSLSGGLGLFSNFHHKRHGSAIYYIQVQKTLATAWKKCERYHWTHVSTCSTR